MVDVIELTPDRMLALPDVIARRFRPSDRFMVWAEGDTVLLKRITPRRVTDLVGEAPEGEPIPEDEINDIVHSVRRQPAVHQEALA